MYILEIKIGNKVEKKRFRNYQDALTYIKEELFAGIISEVDVVLKLTCN